MSNAVTDPYVVATSLPLTTDRAKVSTSTSVSGRLRAAAEDDDDDDDDGADVVVAEGDDSFRVLITASNLTRFSGVAYAAFFRGTSRFRAYPRFTLTMSPAVPLLTMSSSSMTAIDDPCRTAPDAAAAAAAADGVDDADTHTRLTTESILYLPTVVGEELVKLLSRYF
jgi:hypothetical protein